jgi:hypothetical protein
MPDKNNIILQPPRSLIQAPQMSRIAFLIFFTRLDTPPTPRCTFSRTV